MRHPRTFLLAGFVLFACSSARRDAASDKPVASTSSAVINGTLDTTHPAVVLVYSQSNQGAGLCTGTIVKVDAATHIGWVATAAHCVNVAPVLVIQGEDYTSNNRVQYDIIDYQADSRYTGAVASEFDIAMIRIAGVDATTPVIPLVTGADGLSIGTPVVSVGYGKTELNQPDDDPNPNTRRWRVNKTLNDVQTRLIGYDMSTSGICQGDSGGPVLTGTGANERVVGIHSFVSGGGGADCNGDGWSGRVTAAATFWNQQLAKAPPADNCAFCEKVANSGNGECVEMTKGCFADAECKGYYDCIGSCATFSCRNQCTTKFPKAQGPIAALGACVCSRACTDKCSGDAQCAGVPKCGYNLPAGDCATCIEGTCCNETFDCTRDGTCYLCLKNNNADPACATNAARKALATCAAKSCKTECADTGLDVGADPVPEEDPAAAPGGKKVTTTEGCAIAAPRARSSSAAFIGLALGLALALRRRRR